MVEKFQDRSKLSVTLDKFLSDVVLAVSSKNFCAHPYETAKTTLSNESDVVLVVSCKKFENFYKKPLRPHQTHLTVAPDA
jgi:hypothetical protein